MKPWHRQAIPKYIGLERETIWRFVPPVSNLPPANFMVYVSEHHQRENEQERMPPGKATEIMRWWEDWWRFTVVCIDQGVERGAILKVRPMRHETRPNTVSLEALTKLVEPRQLKGAQTRLKYYGIDHEGTKVTIDEAFSEWTLWDTGCQAGCCGLSPDNDIRRWQRKTIGEWLYNARWRAKGWEGDQLCAVTFYPDGHRKVRHE